MRAAALCTLIILGGCSVSKEPEPSASDVAQAISPPPEVEVSAAAPTPVAARSVAEENDTFEFAYAYPAAAGAIPSLKEVLDKDLDKTRELLAADARKGAIAAKSNGYPYNRYSHSVDWKVVTDIPAWLSMSALIGFYSGGAHPDSVFDTLLWDKIANVRRAPADLFASKAVLNAAIREPFCKELDKQRANKREVQELGGGIVEFEKCIEPVEQVLILGSSNGKAFDRIGILVAPYNAGPYSEGSYEVTVPVTAKVMAALKPGYRPAFVTQ